jgi:hypothetical protein
MRERRTLVLDAGQRERLERIARNDPKPFRKRRARALLQIADGHSAYWVAKYGLDKPVGVDQVYEWLNRFLAKGIEGLAIRPGRGRKPALFRYDMATSTRISGDTDSQGA